MLVWRPPWPTVWLPWATLALLSILASTRAYPSPLESLSQLVIEDQGLTCFTCSNVTDNEKCNRYAIDRPCESGLRLCRTDHLVEHIPGSTRPRSVRISKTCVAASDCSRGAVGCRTVSSSPNLLSVCTSCCDWSYCNELAPSDSLSAVLALSRSQATHIAVPSVCSPCILALVSFVWAVTSMT